MAEPAALSERDAAAPPTPHARRLRPAAAPGPRLRSPLCVVEPLWRQRDLVIQLTRRDVAARYRGSVLGVFWTLARPLLLLATFTFVFSSVFEARWDIPVPSRAGFALILFAGLIVFYLFADSTGRAPGLLAENGSYVKRVVFPLEILPWVVVLSQLVQTLIAGLVLLLAYGALLGLPPATALWLPALLVPIVLFTLGVCWFLAALAPYLRDIEQIVPVLIMLLMFLSPLFYPASALPESLRELALLNPLAWSMEAVRGALFEGRGPDPIRLLAGTAASWLVAWLGLAWFTAMRRGFADVC